MRETQHMRYAFTMLEVVFVTVILGIVASIGAEIIANVYESYIVQRAQYRAAIKTELALNQIANRLRYAIPGTVYANNGTGTSATLVPINNITSINSDRLQWVAYDGDSFEARTNTNIKPGWSGFIDLQASSERQLITPGSNLNLVTTVVSNLGGVVANNTYIYFPDGTFYQIANIDNQTIHLNGSGIPSGSNMYERYKLAWSSYAITIENGDLFLYYNFMPTPMARLGDNKSLLLKNVTNFRFKGNEGSLRIKICKEEPIGDSTVHTCKEKVIF
ncbi:MAG: prepilin-type N-terminal cleavage/methylation domain-containing protein [Sulfurovum sp.]|nr:prepilin-type N-terminal cleavage/methylation domain-containing protein [Sulfurovum sp.]MCB4744338.1 prepilin-type N-terminal cleavage/methylation domain-containing protein [Sulfurovum sp.]MCB4746450.1 prepilin-type N-terminal cleavage/methylation domain-containing protein [Sulfurovum sp.]MCB4749258.1 prepilin-type N-terminal cleavage/methylation domain-containing protein [Sulfurovum sp.]MCB4750613.1 prepilin-type N-terminal cleavage/methylation domain-containing protein [Sulfurovum sp.]